MMEIIAGLGPITSSGIRWAQIRGFGQMPKDVFTLAGFAGSATFGESTINATPQNIDANVAFAHAEDNFDGGTLTLGGPHA